MDIPLLSLAALAAVILISRYEKVNIGLVALALAWVIGVYAARLSASEVVAGFPLSMFLVLFGVTYLFSLASLNGTLERVTQLILSFSGGRTFALPIIFFILPLVVSTVGPGNIGSVALFAPLAMQVAHKTGLGAFFMTVMVVSGANAGTFSPFAPTGIIANGLLDRLGVVMDPWWEVFLPTLLTQTFIAMCSYVVFISTLKKKKLITHTFDTKQVMKEIQPLQRPQILTLVAIALLVVLQIWGEVDLGFLAILLSAVLVLLGAADGEAAMKVVPWNTILMVCGVSTLVAIVETTGGLDLFTTWLAQVSDPLNITAVLGLVVGIVSSYSSSSAVVIPTFIPMAPGILEKLGGGNIVDLISTINVASHVVDVSPLSTLGALCIASAAAYEDKGRLFRRLMYYGLSMSLFGALVCFIFFGLF